jgi:Bacterial regulatory protein, Fis family
VLYKAERAVILSRDDVLPNPLHKNQTELLIPSLHRARTFHSSMALEDSDRALILETLEQAGWIVGGPRGAAAKLGLKRTTLLAKMRRFGISRSITQEGTSVPGVAQEDAQIVALESQRAVSLHEPFDLHTVIENEPTRFVRALPDSL